MGLRGSTFSQHILLVLFSSLLIALTGCDATKHLKEGQYLLKKNNLKLDTDKGITKRGELKDNIERLIVQKPNTHLVMSYMPYKVWLYNLRYKKFEKDSANFQLKSKTVERPVVYDSSLVTRSVNNIRSYLFNQGYFYPKVSDTTRFKGRKAYVDYIIETGVNFLINKTTLDVDDSAIYTIVNNSMDQSVLQGGTEFSMSLLEQERSRITNVLREHGYYKFTQENIVDFTLDTFNKELLRDIDNPFESAINFIALQKKQKKPTLDINIVIRAENRDAYKRYVINRVSIYPDFVSREDAQDSTLLTTVVDDVRFRYHKYYIRENIILKHVFLQKGELYRQSDYDATINKLNQLGVFQTIRIILPDDTSNKEENGVKYLNAIIVMSPANKYEFNANFEVSTGTTYVLGVMPTISFRDHNLAKGANLLTTSVSGGLESTYSTSKGENFFQHFSLITKTFGVNVSVDFPKFIVPFKVRFAKKNLPRTIIGVGTTLLDRVQYFTLANTSANLSYNWKETSRKSWDFSPAFMNIIRLPFVSDSFQRRLDSNQFLKNSYRETFIEGENLSFTYSNQFDNKGRSYTYAKLGLEEAGALMSGLDNLGVTNITYSQYLKLDFDVRRYINRRRSQIAGRFYGGVGIPYGRSPTLPYVKQYFVGGAYSIRGWRIRTLGPGSYYNPADEGSSSFIDRTGDVKLEMNGEYRFDIIQLFSGSIKLKGAVFADAGNIWLAQSSANYPQGEFAFSKLGNDIAISAGAGARLDLAGFFIFRIDGAVPVKVPYNNLHSYGGWTSPFNKPSWFNDIVLNFAIGYPF